MSDQMLTAKEVARRLGVDAGTVRRWARQGRLLFTRTPGGALRVHSDYVEQLRQELSK